MSEGFDPIDPRLGIHISWIKDPVPPWLFQVLEGDTIRELGRATVQFQTQVAKAQAEYAATVQKIVGGR